MSFLGAPHLGPKFDCPRVFDGTIDGVFDGMNNEVLAGVFDGCSMGSMGDQWGAVNEKIHGSAPARTRTSMRAWWREACCGPRALAKDAGLEHQVADIMRSGPPTTRAIP